jgi:signal transduction histidine kinase
VAGTNLHSPAARLVINLQMLELSPNIASQGYVLERSILVCLAGTSQTLADACRATLEYICPASYHFEQHGSSGVPGGCDIYIWDFESCPTVPNALIASEDAAKVVIVNKSSLSSLRRKLPAAGFTYLQNPVTPLSLRAVLESAIARLELGRDERPGSSRLRLDRDRILQQLLETNLKLHEHDQERTNFLTRSIHDIRVPLTAIQGYCGLLLAGQVGSFYPEQTQILERMQRSLTRLGRLVEAMMDLGAGSQFSNKLKLEHASIETSVQQAVYEIAPFVERKQIVLSLDIEPPNGALLFDAEQLEQVLLNLLDNACKFTPSGGSITIRGRSVGAQGLVKIGLLDATAGYRIDITDTGRGINPEQLEQIFDEHTSFGRPMDRSGWGLGLAICRMIVDAHKGRIWASTGDQGSSFSFVLPVAHSLNDSHLSHAAV